MYKNKSSFKRQAAFYAKKQAIFFFVNDVSGTQISKC